MADASLKTSFAFVRKDTGSLVHEAEAPAPATGQSEKTKKPAFRSAGADKRALLDAWVSSRAGTKRHGAFEERSVERARS